MRRTMKHLAVTVLTFVIGVSIWSLKPISWQEPTAPLLLTISPSYRVNFSSIGYDYYVVTVKNVSSKTVRGYSLGFICDCRSFNNEGQPLPNGLSFTNPTPARQTLRPGESQEMPLPWLEDNWEPIVWVDLVHYEGGGNWGPDESHTEGYVRLQ